MEEKNRAYRRFKSRMKAIRKRNIDTEHGENPRYNNLHQYSKNKVHESYPCLDQKTRNKGHRRTPKNYNKSINYTATDKKKIDTLYYEED